MPGEAYNPFVDTTDPETLLHIVEHFHSPWVRINFDAGNSFIAGQDPPKFLEKVAKYVTHVHCKDVSHELAAAMRGRDTGISASVVPIGKGANADNISKCIKILEARSWDGSSASKATVRNCLLYTSPSPRDCS